ncbi:hypothetical protein [Spiroplasma endosymbiont of Virgichneumon dumeticola]|uniref:hypothetical protein n=1 Tax=Spiroplasma endosymbiont of Virgichneumon dumeticola TaxID=3139323 RepID=UPI0035C8CD78
MTYENFEKSKYISDVIMQNETQKEINKMVKEIKEKIGSVAFDNIIKELTLMNLTINKMAEYIYSLEQEIIRKNQIIKDKLEFKNEM